jgi:hypothetical protein
LGLNIECKKQWDRDQSLHYCCDLLTQPNEGKKGLIDDF